MTTTPNMNCVDIQKQVQPFLDDLLPETEYQNFHSHLESCSSCEKYMSAIGSFSYALKELGQVEVPSDLIDTVLFNLKKKEAEPPPAGSSKKAWVVGALVLIAAAAAYFGVQHYKKTHPPKEEAAAPAPAVTDEAIQEETPPVRKEAALLYERVQIVSDSKEGAHEETEQADAEENLPAEIREAMSRPAPSAREKDVAVTETIPFHWDFPRLEGASRDQVLDVLSRLGVEFDYRLADLAVVFLSSSEFQLFTSEIDSMAPRALPMSKADLQSFASPKQRVRMSIYFEGAGEAESKSFHWHVQIPSGSGFRLIEVFNKMTLSLTYDSPELVVLTVSSNKIGELVSQLQMIKGFKGDLTQPDASKTPLASYPIEVSIHITEI